MTRPVATIAYRCKGGEMLDEICWRWYGTAAVLWTVLEANPDLARLDARLPAGTLVGLPEVEPPLQGVVQLWD